MLSKDKGNQARNNTEEELTYMEMERRRRFSFILSASSGMEYFDKIFINSKRGETAA